MTEYQCEDASLRLLGVPYEDTKPFRKKLNKAIIASWLKTHVMVERKCIKCGLALYAWSEDLEAVMKRHGWKNGQCLSCKKKKKKS